MEANQRIAQSSVENRLNTSNVFSRNAQSKIYQSFHLQNSNLYNGRPYDSQYKGGFPKLYGYDVSDKSKFSFRDSRISKENALLIQQNTFLRSEVSRLTTLVQTSVTRAEYQRVLSTVSSYQIEISRLNGLLQNGDRSRGQIDRLNALLAQKDAQIRSLRQRIAFLERQGNQPNQWQIRFNESQTIINQLNVQINQQSTQINRLNILIKQYTTKISQLERNPVPSVPKVDPQVGILQSRIEKYQLQITQLRELISQYELTISQYERKLTQYETKFSQYQTQINTLQQKNQKSEQKPKQQKRPSSEPNQEWIAEEGRLNLRIIILLQEINRLRQKQRQLLTKAEQLHAYLLKAQNYIQQIQGELQKNNLKENIPAHIVEKVTRLEEQNSKYTLLIKQLQAKLSNIKPSGIPEDDYYGKIGERDLRIIILLEEINRLNQKVLQIRGYLQKAEDYIEQLQYTLENRQTETVIPAEIQNQISYLSEENNRLNVIIQNYINEIKNLKILIAQLEQRAPVSVPVPNNQIKVQYKIPPEIQTRVAFLGQQNERLNKIIIELQNKPPRVQTKVEYKTQYKTEYKTEYVTDPEVEKEYARLQLRCIILLEEINRLNHSLKQVTGYLINAQNFIQELQVRVNQNSEVRVQQVFVIPPEVQSRLALLASQNQRLNRTIVQLQNRSQRVETRYETKVQYKISPEIQAKIALLASQNERLTRFVAQLNSRPPRVQTKYETKYQTKIQYQIPEQIESQLAKFTLKTIFLLQEINRLNYVVKQIHNHLIQAQNYIESCELRLRQYTEKVTTIQNTRVQYLVPPEIESKLAYLIQENNRLLNLTVQLQNKPARVQTRVQSKVQFRIPPEMEANILALRNQNQRLKLEISRVGSSVVVQKDQTLEFEYGKLQLRSIFLLEEINRLNFLNQEIRQQLITAQNYIFEMENRPVPVGNISPEIEAKISFLAQQNERLTGQISKITLNYQQQINHYKTQITSLTTQINNFKLQISNYVTQINTYKTQINNYNVKISQLETRPVNVSVSKGNDEALTKIQQEWGRQHFRCIILLEQINRLNTKLATVDAERVEVIGHLMNAQGYIQELEVRYNQLEQSKHSSSVTNVTISGSNSAIQQLSSQIVQLQNKSKIESSARDLRIIFLLQEINRLNFKQKQLISQLGGQSRSISSNQEIITLRRQKQQCQRELNEVLNHLRQAEQYIGELMKQNQSFAAERDQLIVQLNNINYRR